MIRFAASASHCTTTPTRDPQAIPLSIDHSTSFHPSLRKKSDLGKQTGLPYLQQILLHYVQQFSTYLYLLYITNEDLFLRCCCCCCRCRCRGPPRYSCCTGHHSSYSTGMLVGSQDRCGCLPSERTCDDICAQQRRYPCGGIVAVNSCCCSCRCCCLVVNCVVAVDVFAATVAVAVVAIAGPFAADAGAVTRFDCPPTTELQ